MFRTFWEKNVLGDSGRRPSVFVVVLEVVARFRIGLNLFKLFFVARTVHCINKLLVAGMFCMLCLSLACPVIRKCSVFAARISIQQG